MGTIELLFTVAITPTQAIIGKMIAAWGFLTLALPPPAPPDFPAKRDSRKRRGVVWAGYVERFRMAGAY